MPGASRFKEAGDPALKRPMQAVAVYNVAAEERRDPLPLPACRERERMRITPDRTADHP
jgi:hypothetical protein